MFDNEASGAQIFREMKRNPGLINEKTLDILLKISIEEERLERAVERVLLIMEDARTLKRLKDQILKEIIMTEDEREMMKCPKCGAEYGYGLVPEKCDVCSKRLVLIQIDESTGESSEDIGPWKGYTLFTEGYGKEDLIRNANIVEQDQDGGSDEPYGLEDAPSHVEKVALMMIDDAIKQSKEQDDD